MLQILIFSLLLITSALCDCHSKTSCDSCMTEPDCVWCADPQLELKCIEADSEDTCDWNVIDFDNSLTVNENNPLSPDPDDHQFVQIAPQKISVTVRPSRPISLNFQVAHAKQFPIDLYFLMDLSFSMSASRENLASLGGQIIDAIKQRTENLATGFGSFVEKNVQPFTSGIAEWNCNPAKQKECVPPYSFYHKASLNDVSADQFSKSVLESPMAGNVDDPEGSLDALMQVMVCGGRIGWRQDSRKIIILSTDRDYHFAGDGKLAGIFTPNDGKCHLNSTGDGSGYYTHGEMLDYPSVSHINSVAQKNNFLVVFAVTDQYQEAYKALADRITGSRVARLSSDGSNMIDIVQDIYDEITDSIKVMSNGPANINVTFKTNCEGGIKLGPNSCAEVPLGSPVSFTADINVDKCLDSPQTVTIFPQGLNENLTVTINTACHCNCIVSGIEATNSGCPKKMSPSC